MQSLKGIFFDPTMHPFFNPGLGSSSFPSKRLRPLASTNWNEKFFIFSSICFLFLIHSLFSLTLYLFFGFNFSILLNFPKFLFTYLLVDLFSFNHFFMPPSKTETFL